MIIPISEPVYNELYAKNVKGLSYKIETSFFLELPTLEEIPDTSFIVPETDSTASEKTEAVQQHLFPDVVPKKRRKAASKRGPLVKRNRIPTDVVQLTRDWAEHVDSRTPLQHTVLYFVMDWLNSPEPHQSRDYTRRIRDANLPGIAYDSASSYMTELFENGVLEVATGDKWYPDMVPPAPVKDDKSLFIL